MPIEKADGHSDLSMHDNFKLPDWVDPDVAFADLPPEKQQALLDAYRFSGFRPGLYQGLTGLGREFC